jgi:mono/diheme cytochrome c family protein
MRHSAGPASFAVALAAATVLLGCSEGDVAPSPTGWRERLRATFYERTARDGSRWGAQLLDPLLAAGTRHLADGRSHEHAIEEIDSLVAALRRGLAMPPLERALVQRDLWAIHDWAADAAGGHDRDAASRDRLETLAARLAATMADLALEPADVARLPDNLARDAASGRNPTSWDPAHPERPFLPADLLDPKGSWVVLGAGADRAVAPFHRIQHGGRSAFLVLVRLPTGIDATLRWVASAGAALAPHSERRTLPPDAAIPDPPRGTTLALLRRTLLVDRAGRVRSAPITERLQLRVLGAGAPTRDAAGRQVHGDATFEWTLDAKGWLDGNETLVPAVPTTTDFVFRGHGEDLFEDGAEGAQALPSPVLESCVACHGAHLGVTRAIQTLSHSLGEIGPLPVPLGPSTAQRETESTVAWKEARADFARLREAFAK